MIRENDPEPKVYFLVGMKSNKEDNPGLPGLMGIISTAYIKSLSNKSFLECFRIFGACFKDLGMESFIISKAELVDVILSSKYVDGIPAVIPNKNFKTIMQIDIKNNQLQVYTTDETKDFQLDSGIVKSFESGLKLEDLEHFDEWKPIDNSPLDNPEGS